MTLHILSDLPFTPSLPDTEYELPPQVGYGPLSGEPGVISEEWVSPTETAWILVSCAAGTALLGFAYGALFGLWPWWA
jgi:hypothetical protein